MIEDGTLQKKLILCPSEAYIPFGEVGKNLGPPWRSALPDLRPPHVRLHTCGPHPSTGTSAVPVPHATMPLAMG